MKTTYYSLIQKLFNINLHTGMKFGLQNMQRLCEALGHPEKSFKSVHVAGTNGKGSVSIKVAQGIRKSGADTALYTSPHISSFRERIRVNNAPISEEEAAGLLTRIFAIIEEKNIPATFFEITTALAFQYFAEKKVDWAVFETGLGGRLDATNVITPEISVITSISLEHTEILGPTIEAIAREKAGIIKPGRPVVIGPRVPFAIISEHAAPLKSPIYQVMEQEIFFELENCSIAQKVMELLGLKGSEIESGLRARQPCRMEILPGKNTIVLDVAHNPDGLARLFMAMKKAFPNRNVDILCGFSSNKDILSCLEIINKHSNTIHFVEANSHRAASTSTLLQKAKEIGIPDSHVHSHPTIKKGLEELLITSDKNNSIALACGTFFIMSDVRRALGIIEPRDEFPLQE